MGQIQPHLSDALQNICMSLSSRGKHPASEIAEILDVDLAQVNTFLKAGGDKQELDRLATEAAKLRAATHPIFNEVVQVLLPTVRESDTVELSLVDKRSKCLGSVSIPMGDVMQAVETGLEGPFCTDNGIELV